MTRRGFAMRKEDRKRAPGNTSIITSKYLTINELIYFNFMSYYYDNTCYVDMISRVGYGRA